MDGVGVEPETRGSSSCTAARTSTAVRERSGYDGGDKAASLNSPPASLSGRGCQMVKLIFILFFHPCEGVTG